MRSCPPRFFTHAVIVPRGELAATAQPLPARTSATMAMIVAGEGRRGMRIEVTSALWPDGPP
jgi:hypothetical protein